MRKLALSAILVALIGFALNAGRLLVVRDLRKADAILLLEGDSAGGPRLALELLQQGYAPRVLLDASDLTGPYRWTYAELAEQYVHTLPPDIARSVSVCAMSALSTVEEAVQVRRCLDAVGARSVLLVTSEYHTRRARSIFHHTFPDRQIGVVGIVEWYQFGPPLVAAPTVGESDLGRVDTADLVGMRGPLAVKRAANSPEHCPSNPATVGVCF